MAEKFYTLLTEIGKAKIANSAGFGSKINFVKMKVGDGGGFYYNPREDQEDLINTVWEGNITHVAIDEKNPNWINVEMMIPANVGGFMIREYGVFDEDNNMLAIAKCAESYKPLAEDGSTKELIMKMVLTVSNTENITLKIDPTIIFAKKSEIEILENKIKNIKIPVTSVNSKTGAIELKAEDIKTNSGESVESQLADITKQQDDITTKQGDLINLKTTNKTNLVNAVNELFTNANSGKSSIANVVGNPLLASDTFQQQSNKIQNLKNTFASNLTSKQQPSNGNESLNNLINKVANINTGKRFITGKIYTSEFRDRNYNESYTKYTRTINIPFKIGLFVVDFKPFVYPAHDTHLVFLQDGFINDEFNNLYSIASTKGGLNIHAGAKIEDYTVDLDWSIYGFPKNEYINWIAVEK